MGRKILGALAFMGDLTLTGAGLVIAVCGVILSITDAAKITNNEVSVTVDSNVE